MPFCTSCGAQNPDGAKFCAKCGSSLADAATLDQGPISPVKPKQGDNLGLQDNDFYQPVRDSDPTVPRAASGFRSGESGQTNFYMAAAGVSSGAKLKRFIIFIVVIAVVGTGLFWLIRFSIQKQKETREALQQKAVQSAPVEPGTDTASDNDANAPAVTSRTQAEETSKQAVSTSKETAKDPQKTKKSTKSRKKTRKKRN